MDKNQPNPAQQASDAKDDGLAAFTEYFCRNYPGPDTIIGRPEWHAPKLFRAAKHAIEATRELTAAQVEAIHQRRLICRCPPGDQFCICNTRWQDFPADYRAKYEQDDTADGSAEWRTVYSKPIEPQGAVEGEDKYRRALQTIHEFAEEGGTHWEWSATRVARQALGIPLCGDCGDADCLDCREPHE